MASQYLNTMFVVYILKLADNSYYVGFTNDLQRRLHEHALGIACEHTKKIPMKALMWSEKQPDRIAARKREKEIKGWRREKKERLWKSLSLS
ncbi:MAG TPA: GIY-YIG nuclease family protein [Candidatus Peribacteraceae bacterium]|nr:GIY-YIG nuclease family protein [Candidatus Peribacteraceae bacterium]